MKNMLNKLKDWERRNAEEILNIIIAASIIIGLLFLITQLNSL
jgi:hypothetical protein